MFKIGEFSRFTRVSVKMLRHYDELGLLKPAHVDPFTSYRYYTADQLPRLHRLLALKDLGFSLEQIALLLDEELSPDELRGMLKLRRAEIRRDLAAAEAQLAQVEARLARLTEPSVRPPYEIILRQVAPLWIAGIRQDFSGAAQGVSSTFERLERYAAEYQARAPLPPLLLYHDQEYLEQSSDLEVAVPVLEKARQKMPASSPIAIRQLPGHTSMACTIHTGHYHTLPLALSALLSWIEQHAYDLAGPTREVFLRFGADQRGYDLPPGYLSSNSAEWVTELQIPVSSRHPVEG